MDDARFDHLSIHLAARLPRRSLAGLLATSGLALPIVTGAKRKKKCKPPKRKCGKRCRDVQSDPANCGTCGRACRAGETCSGGACLLSCPAGQKACAGTCIPAASCCTSAECPGNDQCTQGVCLARACFVLNKPEGTFCDPGVFGGECRGGACTPCVGRTSLCTDTSECCGSTLPAGAVICASNLHVPSIACADDTQKYCCGRPGATCRGNCDCCADSVCSSAGRCCRANGQSCLLAGECCSGACTSGVCS